MRADSLEAHPAVVVNARPGVGAGVVGAGVGVGVGVGVGDGVDDGGIFRPASARPCSSAESSVSSVSSVGSEASTAAGGDRGLEDDVGRDYDGLLGNCGESGEDDGDMADDLRDMMADSFEGDEEEGDEGEEDEDSRAVADGADNEAAAAAARPTLRATKTTAILDWDDTICPSTHLSQLGMRVDDAGDLPPPLREQLALLEAAVINIVREALRFGAVVVITNAEAGWVELSGRRFLPEVVDFFREHNIKIVSARTTFEADFPDAPSSWKVAAFSQEVTQMFPDEDELNVLVLGDSMSERDAAHALGSRMPNSKVKTVKFVERPSIDQLMRQVQLVAQSLPDLASYSSSFDVDLVVSASA